LLLDEPAAGLNESETQSLMQAIRRVRAETGCGVLVIEHDMRLIMGLCDRIHVLASGRTLAIGSPADILADERVVSAYLGLGRDDAATP
jgi:branched-chain amino acid transport system ATP-binding protein